MFKEGDRIVTGHRLVKFLGRGNFGEVWQAMAPGNTYAALKFLNLEQSQGRKEYRAIQPLKHLRHAHLLQMTAIWLLDENGQIIPDDQVMEGMLLDTVRGTLTSVTQVPDDHRPSTLIIAMPFADKSLDHLLREYKQKGAEGIPRDELIEYMTDAAKAIDFLNSPHHDLGQGPVAIRHCDVKPENLLLMGQSVVLCDFGVSRTILSSSSTRKTTMGGSLAYMAPECVNGEVTAYSDQFSLAISYLELRTGKLPFENLSQGGVIEQRCRGVLDLSDLPGPEAAVIRRATSVQPTRRYASALQMVEALREASRRKSGVSGLPLVLAGLGAAGAVAAAAVFWWPKPEKIDPAENEPPKVTGSGDGKPLEVPREVPQWQKLEDTALNLIESDSLTDQQWQQAVAAMSQAIDAGLPIERLTFRSPISLPTVSLSNSEKSNYLPNVFVLKPDGELDRIHRADKSISLASYRGQKLVRNSTIAFDSIRSFGRINDQTIALGKREDKYVIAPFDTDSPLPKPLDQVRSSDKMLQLWFAGDGRHAVVLDWGNGKLMSVGEPSVTLSLESVNAFDSPVTKLSADGQWLAIQTLHSLHVARLDGSMALTPMTLPDDNYKTAEEIFAIQSDEQHGYIALCRQETVDGESLNRLQLLRFSVDAPEKFELLDIPQKHEVFHAQLFKSGGQVQLAFGGYSGTVLWLPNMSEYKSPRTLVAKNDPGTITACGIQSDIEPSPWLVFATDNNRLYLQSLAGDSRTIEIAQTANTVRYLQLDSQRLIAGSEGGEVEIFDFRQIHLMIEAAIKRNKSVTPAKATTNIRS